MSSRGAIGIAASVPRPGPWAAFGDDLRVLTALVRGSRGRGDQAERLERFYAPQAEAYDRFRERLLHGRGELIAALPLPPGGTLVELGGGTGRNLEFAGARLPALGASHIVDLCPSLLARAQARADAAGWTNVVCHQADATSWQPPAPADAVLLSYALTMIPDWEAALANAVAMLKPGGWLGVVDFFVSHNDPGIGRVRHGAFARWFWPRWFGHDGVRPEPRHLDRLHELVNCRALIESEAAVPYLRLRAPFYRFLGVRRG